MTTKQKLARWVLENKQIGVVFSFEHHGAVYWSSVAIQKWQDVIKVYVDEILESQMHAENYSREEIAEHDSIESALEFVSTKTRAEPEMLFPCKGQKIFDPKLVLH